MPLVLLLCYPLFVHLGVVTHTPALQAMAIIFLAAAVQYPGLRQGKPFPWAVLLLSILLAAWLATIDLAKYVLYIPPIIIPLLVWSGFTRTLMPGQVPLITGIAEHVHGQLPPDIERYTRRMTILWAALLAGLSLWTALLSWLGSPMLWSLFTNFINYALVAVLFVAEFFYRRRRFPDFQQPPFREYLHIVFHSGVHRS